MPTSAIDAETAQFVAVAVQAALQPAVPSRPPRRRPRGPRRRQRAAVLTRHRRRGTSGHTRSSPITRTRPDGRRIRPSGPDLPAPVRPAALLVRTWPENAEPGYQAVADRHRLVVDAGPGVPCTLAGGRAARWPVPRSGGYAGPWREVHRDRGMRVCSSWTRRRGVTSPGPGSSGWPGTSTGGMSTSASWPTWHPGFRRSRRHDSPFCSPLPSGRSSEVTATRKVLRKPGHRL